MLDGKTQAATRPLKGGRSRPRLDQQKQTRGWVHMGRMGKTKGCTTIWLTMYPPLPYDNQGLGLVYEVPLDLTLPESLLYSSRTIKLIILDHKSIFALSFFNQ